MRQVRILLVVLLALGGLTFAGEEIDREVSASPRGSVEIDNLSGSVRVVGWGRDKVTVTGTLGRGTERLDVEERGDRVIIKVVFPEGRNNRVEATDLDVRIPSGSRLEVSTVSASIDVSEVTGRVSLNSVSGAIDVEGKLDDVEINNVSGRIRIDGSFESGEFHNVSGAIEAHVDPARRCEFDTVSGSILLSLPSHASGDFEVSTFSGNIDSDLGPSPRKVSKWTPGQELSFSVGSGNVRYSVRSFSGRIRIEED